MPIGIFKKKKHKSGTSGADGLDAANPANGVFIGRREGGFATPLNVSSGLADPRGGAHKPTLPVSRSHHSIYHDLRSGLNTPGGDVAEPAARDTALIHGERRTTCTNNQSSASSNYEEMWQHQAQYVHPNQTLVRALPLHDQGLEPPQMFEELGMRPFEQRSHALSNSSSNSNVNKSNPTVNVGLLNNRSREPVIGTAAAHQPNPNTFSSSTSLSSNASHNSNLRLAHMQNYNGNIYQSSREQLLAGSNNSCNQATTTTSSGHSHTGHNVHTQSTNLSSSILPLNNSSNNISSSSAASSSINHLSNLPFTAIHAPHLQNQLLSNLSINQISLLSANAPPQPVKFIPRKGPTLSRREAPIPKQRRPPATHQITSPQCEPEPSPWSRQQNLSVLRTSVPPRRPELTSRDLQHEQNEDWRTERAVSGHKLMALTHSQNGHSNGEHFELHRDGHREEHANRGPGSRQELMEAEQNWMESEQERRPISDAPSDNGVSSNLSQSQPQLQFYGMSRSHNTLNFQLEDEIGRCGYATGAVALGHSKSMRDYTGGRNYDPRTAGYPHPQHTNPLDNYGYLPPNMPPTRAIGTPFQSPHRHSLHTTYQRTQQPQLHRQTRISHDHLPYSSSPRSANNVIGHGPSSNSSSNAAVAYYAHYGSQDSGQLGGSGQRLDRSSGGIDGCGVVSRAPIGLPKLPANMFDVLPHSNPGVGYIPDWLRIYITLPEFVKSIAEEAVNSQYSIGGASSPTTIVPDNDETVTVTGGTDSAEDTIRDTTTLRTETEMSLCGEMIHSGGADDEVDELGGAPSDVGAVFQKQFEANHSYERLGMILAHPARTGELEYAHDVVVVVQQAEEREVHRRYTQLRHDLIRILHS